MLRLQSADLTFHNFKLWVHAYALYWSSIRTSCKFTVYHFVSVLQSSVSATISTASSESVDSGVDLLSLASPRSSSSDKGSLAAEDPAIVALKRSRPAGQASDSDADSVSSEGVSSKRSRLSDASSNALPPNDSLAETPSPNKRMRMSDRAAAIEADQHLLELSDLSPALTPSLARPVRSFILPTVLHNNSLVTIVFSYNKYVRVQLEW